MTIPSDATRSIEQIVCPIERAKAITVIARQDGTLPGQLARLRLAALREGRQAVTTGAELARRVGMRRSRVSTLLHTGAGPDDQTPLIKENQQSC